MQDFHGMLRKGPALLGQWKLVQYKDKSFLCAHDTLGNQLWSCLVLGTRPPEACRAASYCQCYIQVITHFATQGTFGHVEAPAAPAPTGELSGQRQAGSSAGAHRCEWGLWFAPKPQLLRIGEALYKVTEVNCSTQQERGKTGQVHP